MTFRTAVLACVIASVAGPLPTGTAAAQGLAVREWQVPWERTRSSDPFVAPDGAIWYVDYARGFLGRLDPVTAAVEEWPSPAGSLALPYAMTVDDQDRLWYVETGVRPNRMVAFDAKAKRFVVQQPVRLAELVP